MLMDWLAGTFGSDGAYGITVAVSALLSCFDYIFEVLFS